MTDLIEILPEIEPFSHYGGSWNDYIEALYSFFCADFIHSSPKFRGAKLALKRHPVEQGKEATFWHLTSEGKEEAERTPDMRRCERIRWPRPIIDNSDHSDLKVWAEKRKSERRIHIWFQNEGYLVVLNERKDYILPWTAFYVERDHQRRKYLKRWERYGAF